MRALMRGAVNVPNAITLARILLVPLVLWLLVATPPDSLLRWFALAAYILSIATDGVDGAIARRKGLVTELGKLLDPIADKLLIGGALLTLSILGEAEWWLCLAILLREVSITVYRLAMAKRRVLAASTGGKLKTILQAIVVGLIISPFAELWTPLAIAQFWLLVGTAAVTVLTGLQYLLAELRLARDGRG